MNNDLNISDVTPVVKSEDSKDKNVEIDLNLVSEHMDEELIRLDRKDVDYTIDSDDRVLFRTETLVKIVTQLSTVIDLISPRKVSRGLNFIVSNGKLTVVNPSELYYFKADIDTEELTFEDGTIFHIDFAFLTKMIRFLPLKVLVYRKNNVFYLRLVTGDLELIDTLLLDTDKNKLVQDWDILPTVIQTLNKTEVLSSLGSLSKLYSFASDLPRRTFDIKDGIVQFMTPCVQASASLVFPEVRLIPPVVSYILKACSLCSSANTVDLHETSSQTITRYAVVYDGISYITNFAGSKFDDEVKARSEFLPVGTAVQFTDLKYVLEYVNSITYASGKVTLQVKGNKIIGKVELNNNNSSDIELPVVSNEISLPSDLNVVVNAKDLYKALNTLDANLTTYIGYSAGLIYLWNSGIILTIMTFGGKSNE